ncbi:M16 family metallopeptidase [Sulfurovum riftiae]|uniref:Peptidase M16 n=1 Tax=Sulfurovum riftiae TaxID=1630136 RepID=A0A151CIE0_9BACT|nr:insulinase family protein [Sulfurovum riftiae]KYJ87286.1 hypothetical protein AS592_02805 [Sulfurovum riftiae]
MKRAHVILLFVMTFLHAVEMPTDKRLVEGMLPNTFSYRIMHNEKPKEMVEFRLYVRAGSLEEEDDQQGLAHFIEHMAFNGTEHFKKNELISYLESIGLKFGGDLNANTNYGCTLYKLTVPVKGNNVDTALTILRDWAGGVRFDPKEFDKERGVVLEEKRLRNTAGFRLYKQYAPVFFEGSRYKDRLVIGKEKVLKHAPVQRAVDFYKKWYRPELMTLVVVGDINASSMEAKIKKTFGSLTNSNHTAPITRLVPEHNSTRVLSLTDKELHGNSVDIYYLERKLGTVTEAEKRADIIDWMVQLLFNLNAQKEVLKSESKALTLRFGMQFVTPLLRAYDFSATYKKEDRDAAFEELNRLIWRFAKYGFSQKDLETVRKQLMALNENTHKEIKNLRSAVIAGRLVNTLDNGAVYVDEAYDYNLSKKILGEVSIEDVNKRFREIVDIKDRVVLFTGTTKEKVSKAEVLAMVQKAKEEAKKADKEVSTATALLAEIPHPKKIVEKVFDKEHGIYFYRLENNVTVSFMPRDYRKNEVLVGAISVGGYSTLPTEMLDDAQKASSWVVSSAPGSFKPYALRELLAGKKLSDRFAISRFDETIDGSSSSEDLESLLQLLYLQIMQPKIDPAVAKRQRNALMARQKEADRNPAYRFDKAVKKFYYMDNPRIRFDTNESIAKLDTERMLSIFKEKFGDMNHFHFVIVGDTTPQKVEKLIAVYLGNLPVGSKGETYDSTPYAHRKGEQTFVKHFNTTDIANIMLQYRSTLPYSIHNNARIDALQNILTIRLRNLIREEKSGTYGIGVGCQIIRELHDRAICTISFAADPLRKDELIASVRKSIDTFIKEGPGERELKNYKTEFNVAYTQMQKMNRFWSGMLLLSAKFGTPVSEYLSFPKAVEKLEPEEVRRVAEKLFGGDLLISERLPERKLP